MIINADRKELVELEMILMRIITDATGKLSTLGISFGIILIKGRMQNNLPCECKETESQIERFNILWIYGLILVKNLSV